MKKLRRLNSVFIDRNGIWQYSVFSFNKARLDNIFPLSNLQPRISHPWGYESRDKWNNRNEFAKGRSEEEWGRVVRRNDNSYLLTLSVRDVRGLPYASFSPYCDNLKLSLHKCARFKTKISRRGNEQISRGKTRRLLFCNVR